MESLNLLDIKEKYLNDDGFDRDIVDLAKAMKIDVFQAYNELNEFIALTQIDKMNRIIIVNNYKIRDASMLKFICAYQLAEVIILNQKELCSLFKLEFIEPETYRLAQEIFNRSNKYKKDGELVKKKTKNK